MAGRLNDLIIRKYEYLTPKLKRIIKDEKDDHKRSDPGENSATTGKKGESGNQEISNQGKLNFITEKKSAK